MTTLAFRFPGRRFHATPWGHHVNEGLVEWPPAPWRVLRALLSVGFTTMRWGEVPAEARLLIEKLASVLPRYKLPRAVGAHSRHYMPTDGKPTLVLDTWAQIDAGQLIVTWPVDLPAAQRALLTELAARMNYLGRSESWVEARLLDGDPGDHDCTPDSAPGQGWEQVPLLAAVSSEEYLAWRGPQVERRLPEAQGVGKGNQTTTRNQKLKNSREAATAVYPVDLIACLLVETPFLRRHGWSQPPGSRRVYYWRRRDSLQALAPAVQRIQSNVQAVEFMLLSMTSGSGNDHALPARSRALPQGELLHRALVSLGGKDTPLIRGTHSAGQPLTGHRHAHLLHLDLDDDGHLDHCLVWAPAGLDSIAQTAVRAVRRTFTKGGTSPLRLAIAASGRWEDLHDLRGAHGEKLRAYLGRASEWVTFTPFVPPRFPKPRGKNSVAGQVGADLASRGFQVAEIEVLDPRDACRLQLRHAIRVRRSSPPPVDCGFAVRIRFREQVRGPIAIGYGSHFGLGVFEGICSKPAE